MKEHQIYLLNNKNPKEATFNLEQKARSLTGEYSLCKVFAIYDCCRVPLDLIKELNKLYGGKGIEIVDQCGADLVKYTHIQACGPGGIAEADGGFAKRFHDFAEERSKMHPEGILSFPSDFIKGDWRPGQIITSGGEDFEL